MCTLLVLKICINFALLIYFAELSRVIPKITLVYIAFSIFDCTRGLFLKVCINFVLLIYFDE